MLSIVSIGAAIFIAFLLYWLVNPAGKSQKTNLNQPYNQVGSLHQFEFASEVSLYPADENQLAKNSINISGERADDLRACWEIEQNRLDEAAQAMNIALEESELVLRLYESSDQVRYQDIAAKSNNGCCRLRLQPYNAYYVSLGFMNSNRFIPILTSNTVIKNQ
jgi:hypothetical protein